jgi:hypothetical protein
MHKSFFWYKVLRTPDYQKCYFQQDMASPHKAALEKKFIAKNEWPPRSQGLNPCDYFLYGYLIVPSVTKNIGGSKILLDERNRKHSGSNVKSHFFEFSKKVRIIDFRW